MPRKRRETYFCINISILNKKDNPADKYESVFRSLVKQSAVKVRGSDYVKVRTVGSVTLSGQKFLTGKITKYTRLESEQWYDESKNEGTFFDIPDNVHPNMVETEYYFWPEKHKLFIKRSNEAGSPSFYQVERYLTVILNNTQEEEFNISIIQSKDSIERIIKAKEIQYLNFQLSYSNADTNEPTDAFLDNLYREAEVSEIRSQLRSTNNNRINGNSDFVKSNLRLARKTGNAEARIEENDGTKVTLNTSDHPASVQVREVDNEDFNDTLFKKFNELL